MAPSDDGILGAILKVSQTYIHTRLSDCQRRLFSSFFRLVDDEKRCSIVAVALETSNGQSDGDPRSDLPPTDHSCCCCCCWCWNALSAIHRVCSLLLQPTDALERLFGGRIHGPLHFQGGHRVVVTEASSRMKAAKWWMAHTMRRSQTATNARLYPTVT